MLDPDVDEIGSPRPPKLIFETGADTTEKAKVYHPQNNEHFTIRKGSGDRLIVEED